VAFVNARQLPVVFGSGLLLKFFVGDLLRQLFFELLWGQTGLLIISEYSLFVIHHSLLSILFAAGEKKIPASATWQGDRMKFRRELIQEKAMAETMRDDKGTIKFSNCQYLFVVFLKKA
jgi:hypothetical protein